jgi:septal ring factor EnvC (AmiA/AmiB activator)
MKKIALICILLFFLFVKTYAQTRTELEGRRQKTLEEISYVDNLLKATSREKKEGMSELKIIGNKLTLRESVLYGLRQEIDLLKERIDLNTLALDMMESDLVLLKKDYENAILHSFRTSKGHSEINYVLSAKDFNQGYKRIKYLQQATKFRRKEAEIIIELKSQTEISKKRLEEDLLKISDLKTREEKQKNLLESEQQKKQKIVKSLGNKERQLQRDLEEKKRIAKKIENEIAKLVEDERAKTNKAEFTPEQKLISDDFSGNKGRLPWPVEKGIITSHFGIQNHPVLKYVTEDNIDIEITSFGETPVRSIFKGEVVRIFSIRGANMAVIIRHGKYLSVYQNVVNLKVKTGDKVETNEEIGKVFNDSDNGNKAVLKFMVFDEKVKMDPELWISKKN